MTETWRKGGIMVGDWPCRLPLETPMTPEKKVQTQIINYLKKREEDGLKMIVNRRQTSNGGYRNGLPDLWVICNGKHLEIEVKALNGKPSSQQLLCRKQLEECGSLYVMPHSLEEFVTYFEEVIG